MNSICIHHAYTNGIACIHRAYTKAYKKNLKKMATIKAVVRKARTDGFFPVYIRIVHRSRMGYIKTDKIVSPKGIAKSGEKSTL